MYTHIGHSDARHRLSSRHRGSECTYVRTYIHPYDKQVYTHIHAYIHTHTQVTVMRAIGCLAHIVDQSVCTYTHVCMYI